MSIDEQKPEVQGDRADKPVLFISTGDASGDWHAAAVVKALRALVPNLQVYATGGNQLRQAGATLLADQRGMGKMGAGAFAAIPYHLVLGLRFIKAMRKHQPQAVLLIDYGGYHLWLSRFIKRLAPEFAPFYYIPPQLWASRAGRMKVIQRCVKKVFCIFPFEEPLYQEAGVAVRFVGHPLLSQLPEAADKASFCARHGLDANRPIIAILPGSRKMELQYLLEPLLQSISPILQSLADQALPLPQFVVAQAANLNKAYFEKQWQGVTRHLPSPVKEVLYRIEGDSHALLSVAQFAMGASGTVTLEAALYGTPMVVMYKGPWFSYSLVKHFIRVEHLALPNLLHCGLHHSEKSRLFPELHQYAVTAEAIAEAAYPWLNASSSSYLQVKQNLAAIRETLGLEQNAAKNVAQALYESNYTAVARS